MQETASASYPKRTEFNVQRSDATLRIAENFESSGEVLTWALIVKHRKKWKDVSVHPISGTRTIICDNLTGDLLVLLDWILSHGIQTLNVAGNSEQTAPGIEAFAFSFLKIPKELARLVLPVGRYSRMRASANLRNWMLFLTLRSDRVLTGSSAQWEIRQSANVVHDILREIFEHSMALFDERGNRKMVEVK